MKGCRAARSKGTRARKQQPFCHQVSAIARVLAACLCHAHMCTRAPHAASAAAVTRASHAPLARRCCTRPTLCCQPVAFLSVSACLPVCVLARARLRPPTHAHVSRGRHISSRHTRGTPPPTWRVHTVPRGLARAADDPPCVARMNGEPAPRARACVYVLCRMRARGARGRRRVCPMLARPPAPLLASWGCSRFPRPATHTHTHTHAHAGDGEQGC
jgi:hypothetical protein